MKTKLLLIIIFLGFIPFQVNFINMSGQTDNLVPAPVFVSITPSGDPANSQIYEINETITLNYKADRFEVDGIMLLGTGSNFTEDINDPLALNFTLSDSFKNESNYEVKFNVTSSYSVFYAYSWSITLDNGTKEEFSFDDGSIGHQIWTKTGPQYPVFDKLENAEDRTGEYYAPLGQNLTFVYTVKDPIDMNDTYVTLVFANSTSDLYNESKSIRINMNQTAFSVNNRSRFEFNYTMSQRILFFTSFNDYGWERINANTNLNHRITSGFSFELEYSQELEKYTELDNIEFNLTSFNETNEDEFYYRYRVFENETLEDPISDWQDIYVNTFEFNSTIVNDTNNYNTTKTIYHLNLGKFEVNNSIEIQSYVEYLTGSYNESETPDIINIKDSRPTISVTSANNTYTGNENATIIFNFETMRGSILNATILSNQTLLSIIKDKSNFTVKFTDANDSFVEGDHIIVINVTNSIPIFNSSVSQNRSQQVIVIYKVDHTLPVVTFNPSNVLISENDGTITLKFDYNDETLIDSGIKYVTLDWGNFLTINATNLHIASMKYRYEGNYTVILTAYDNVGNNNSIQLEVTVAFETISKSKTDTSPINLTVMLLSFMVCIVIIKKRKLL